MSWSLKDITFWSDMSAKQRSGRRLMAKGKYDHIKVPHPWTLEDQAKVDEDCLVRDTRTIVTGKM
jgi:hypothetical protein